MTQYVSWVLDADIRSFFDSVDHEWMLRMVAHRVADRRMLLADRAMAASRRDGRPGVAGDVRGDATGGGDQSAPGEHLSALRARPVGPAMEEEAGARASQSRALRGRLRDGLSERDGRTGDAGGAQGAAGEVQAGTPRGQDAPHRVRGTRGRAPTSAQHTATGYVCVFRIHPLLRMEPRRALCGQAADRRPASQSEVAGGADGAEAPHAHAGSIAASLALQCAARARCLLRAAEQLATLG